MVAVVAVAGCGQDLVLVCHDGVTQAVTIVVLDSVANAPIAQDVELVGISETAPTRSKCAGRARRFAASWSSPAPCARSKIPPNSQLASFPKPDCPRVRRADSRPVIVAGSQPTQR